MAAHRLARYESAPMGEISNLDVSWRSALLFALLAPLIMVSAALLTRNVERSANRWLAAFLFAYAWSQTPYVIGFAGAYTVWPGLTFAPFDVHFLFGPLIYLHARRLMIDGPLGWRWALLVPGAIQIAYYLWAFTSLGDYRAKWDYNDAFHVPYVMPVQTVVSVLLAVGCWIAVWRMLLRYYRFLNDTQSAAVDFDPAWLRRFLVATVVVVTVWTLVSLADRFVVTLSYVAEYPIIVGVSLVLLWLGLEGLSRIRTAFPKMSASRADAAPAAPVAGRDWRAEGAALRDALEENAWHLEPRLSLADIARRMATNETYVSRALNLGLQMNFNRFVNEARVATAKRLIDAEASARLIDVAHRAGFNSKATFNRVFRDIAGVTPSQWRAKNRSQIP